MDWYTVLSNVQRHGLEYVFRRYPGVYRATVADVRDPESRGRIRALVPSIGAREPSQRWFDPAFAEAGSNRGAFFPPNMGDSVFVTFENGDPSRPLMYFGGWYGNPQGASEVPSELGYDTARPPNPRRFGYVSRLGHALVFNETPGSETVELRWHQPATGDPALTDSSKTADRSRGKTSRLRFNADGSVTLASESGAAVVMDATANTVTLSDANGNRVKLASGAIDVTTGSGGTVTVTGATVVLKAETVLLGDGRTYRAVLGERLLQWLRGHKHGSGTGPTSEPLEPPTEALLSTITKLKG